MHEDLTSYDCIFVIIFTAILYSHIKVKKITNIKKRLGLHVPVEIRYLLRSEHTHHTMLSIFNRYSGLSHDHTLTLPETFAEATQYSTH